MSAFISSASTSGPLAKTTAITNTNANTNDCAPPSNLTHHATANTTVIPLRNQHNR
ncbi:hypothetical protein [Bartonella grahamii]|uniref:hypothetical protein n=1 Tax=Bartonella grahamii TaxID=33045 RepID=UPI0037CADD79